MKRLIGLIIAAVFVSYFAAPVLAEDPDLISQSSLYDDVPAPRLQYPLTDKVELSGKDFLEFKWWGDFMGIDHYTFKLYKGYNMYESGLIYKQDIPFTESSLRVKSELFEDSQVYTWSLIQVSFSGTKSDKSYNSFRVIKKK